MAIPAVETQWLVAGIFALLSIFVSAHLIYMHLMNYTQPRFQKYIVRIILMVPFYSIEAWLSLYLPEYSLYFDTLRDIYEGYVIYTFIFLMIEFLGGKARLVRSLELKRPMRHPWPFESTFPSFRPNSQFITMCQAGTLQFVLVKPLTATLALYLDSYELYGDGQFNFKQGYVYITFINNVSISVSLYCLVLFYMATKEALEPFNPLLKFLCVKTVLFFSFWQGVVIAIMVRAGVIHDVDGYPAQHLAIGLQDTIICIEMFIAALCHIWAFSYKEFEDSRYQEMPMLRNVLQVVNFTEVLSDVHDTFLGGNRTEFEMEDTPFISGDKRLGGSGRGGRSDSLDGSQYVTPEHD
eukprot:GFYU01001541.1.p1 GENE.GFYU01001541.1~~GFYU01001541.1.p1  ORF type:complete len:352 (+),score=25.94 GFYU01001541.1:194-1249(+)